MGRRLKTESPKLGLRPDCQILRDRLQMKHIVVRALVTASTVLLYVLVMYSNPGRGASIYDLVTTPGKRFTAEDFTVYLVAVVCGVSIGALSGVLRTRGILIAVGVILIPIPTFLLAMMAILGLVPVATVESPYFWPVYVSVVITVPTLVSVLARSMGRSRGSLPKV